MINMKRLLRGDQHQEFLARLIAAEVIARRGEGPLVRPELRLPVHFVKKTITQE